jgi:hypothetical protein
MRQVNANLLFQAAITGIGRCYLSAFSAEMVTAPWQVAITGIGRCYLSAFSAEMVTAPWQGANLLF